MTPAVLDGWMRTALASGVLTLPALAEGSSRDRLAALSAFGRADLSIARVVEAHLDAVQILHEAGRVAEPGCWYGVWAADDPSASLSLAAIAGGWELSGLKRFCTGAGLVDRALVTVRIPAALLLDIDLRTEGQRVAVDTSGWVTAAFAATSTAEVVFDRVGLAADAVVGPDGWYLARPGFWHGACGPAACWAGGARGLIDLLVGRAVAAGTADRLSDAATGAMAAIGFQLDALIDHTGRAIDADPLDPARAERRALQFRHLVERACTEALDRFGRTLGPRPLAFDAVTSRRCAELQLYLRQCHGEADLAALGAAVRRAGADRSPTSARSDDAAATTDD